MKKIWGKYWAALPKMGIDMLFLFINGKKLKKKGHLPLDQISRDIKQGNYYFLKGWILQATG